MFQFSLAGLPLLYLFFPLIFWRFLYRYWCLASLTRKTRFNRTTIDWPSVLLLLFLCVASAECIVIGYFYRPMFSLLSACMGVYYYYYYYHDDNDDDDDDDNHPRPRERQKKHPRQASNARKRSKTRLSSQDDTAHGSRSHGDNENGDDFVRWV
jgi:hypothetical protein